MARLIDQTGEVPVPVTPEPDGAALARKLKGFLTLSDIRDGQQRFAYNRKPSPLALSSMADSTVTTDQIVNGKTYGLVLNTALTNNAIDMSKSTGGSSGAGIINHTLTHAADGLSGGTDAVTAFSFGTGDGATTAFQLQTNYGAARGYTGTPLIYKNDWQGNQLQYSTPRTNELIHTDLLTDASWVHSGIASVVASGTAPDGTSSYLVTQDTSANNHGIQQNPGTALNIGQTATLSFWVKNGTATKYSAVLDLGASWFTVDFATATSLPTFSMGTPANIASYSASLTAYSSGWYRLSVSVSPAVDTTIVTCILTVNSSYETGTGLTAYFSAPQVEIKASAGATSYIANSTALPVTVTDYSISSSALVTFASAPASAAALTATGTFTYGPRKAVLEVDPNSRALIDFTQSHLYKILDNIGDGTTYARTVASDLTGNRLDFSKSLLNKQLDNIPDGTTYARVLGTALTTNAIDMSLAAGGSSGAGIINHTTSNIQDDAGLGNTAVWGDLSGIADTIEGHNLTDVVQPVLPSATQSSVLTNDGNGNLSWQPKYGAEINCGENAPAGGAFSATSLTQIGNTIVIPNPGQTVNVFADWLAYPEQSGTVTTPYHFFYLLQYSSDGGTTWVDGNTGYLYFADTNGVPVYVALGKLHAINVTPTGDILIRAMGYLGQGAGGVFTINSPQLTFNIYPTSNFSVTGGTLAASLPSTATASGSVTYPSTTGTLSKSLSVSVSNAGVAPDSFSNAITSGSGTITSGATSQTFTVTSGTLTAGTPANVGVDSVVTDSTSPTPQTVTTNTCTITFSLTQAYSAISVSMSETDGTCVATAPTACTATGYSQANASGGNGSYTYSHTIHSSTYGVATITAGATSQKCTVSESHATAKPANVDTLTMWCAVNDTRGTGSVTGSGTLTLTFKSFT